MANMIRIEQWLYKFKDIIEEFPYGKWFIFKQMEDRDDVTLYLWPDGIWRGLAIKSDRNAYYDTLEEAEAILEKYEKGTSRD